MRKRNFPTKKERIEREERKEKKRQALKNLHDRNINNLPAEERDKALKMKAYINYVQDEEANKPKPKKQSFIAGMFKDTPIMSSIILVVVLASIYSAIF